MEIHSYVKLTYHASNKKCLEWIFSQTFDVVRIPGRNFSFELVSDLLSFFTPTSFESLLFCFHFCRQWCVFWILKQNKQRKCLNDPGGRMNILLPRNGSEMHQLQHILVFSFHEGVYQLVVDMESLPSLRKAQVNWVAETAS